LIYRQSVDDCPKALKRVVNKVDKDKGGSSEADDAFIEVKKKKLGNSSKKTGKTDASISGNGTFSLSNSFEALIVDNTDTEEVDSGGGGKTSMSGVQEEGQGSTPLVEKINMFEQQLLAGKCVLLDDEDKPLEKIDYTGDHDSKDEVGSVDNEMASFLAS
ncbi:hypothetical protein Tco_0044477, partial [Tanacetum coccineum]